MKPASLFLLCAIAATAADLRIGIIGTDTSHVIAFSKVLNDPTSPDHIPGAKIVAAFKGGAGDVVVGFDHANYGHMAVMPPAVRTALAQDFS